MTRKWKVHGLIGILLVIVFWYLNWNLSGLRTHWGFFFLWLGYILVIDAIVFYRKNTSLLSRHSGYFAILFLLSIPGWWLFELFNWRMNNWIYLGRETFSNFEFFLLASLSFSTVMPAVFESAELIASFHWYKKLRKVKVTFPEESTLIIYPFLGIIIIIMILLLPDYFYYLIWVALFFILDPINFYLKNKSLLVHFISKDWRPLISLGLGALMCGFFWEMWNFYSYPKWIYRIPMVDFLHIFEMPILGYLGYIPFSLELFALYQTVTGFLIPKMRNFLEVY